MRYWPFVLAGWALLTNGAVSESKADACRGHIPPTLGESLRRRFPEHHLPSTSDSLAEDVQFDKTRGGDGCLLVEVADFDGDGRQDLVVGLPSDKGGVPVVAVALARGRDWSISAIQSWVDVTERLYVRSAPAGTHSRTSALDRRLQPDERKSLKCDNAAVIVGATESTTIAYCYLNHRWLYVWVSD